MATNLSLSSILAGMGTLKIPQATNIASTTPAISTSNAQKKQQYIDSVSSNGATAPVPTKITPPTTSSSPLGSPSANAYVNSLTTANANTPTYTAPTTPISSPTTASANTTTTQPPDTSRYDDAMEAYLASLKNSQDLNARAQSETLTANHLVQADLDRQGGLLQGNQASAALDSRRSNASLADLGIAQTSATNDANVALERLKFEQGLLPSTDPYTLSPGQTRFDAQGNPIASLPDDSSSAPTSVQEYQFAQSQGYNGSYADFKNNGGNDRVLSATEAQSLGVPFGTKASDAYGITPTKPLTESQAKDLTYGQRGSEANDIIGQLESTVAKYNPILYSTYKTLEPNTIGNTAVPDNIRQVAQAERNFASAVLRRESGAAISASEYATVNKQYFPQPGDDAATLAQKAQNRATAINSFLQNAGQSGVNGGGSSNGGGVVQSAIGPIDTSWDVN